MKTTQRIIYLDIIRILACCMIVLMHSPHPNAGISGVILTPISFLTAPGIGLFFMVSGALLLPINESTNKFLKKRLTKVLWPTIFWSLFYLLIKYVYKETTSDDIIHSIISMPFSPQGHGIMWFMYTLIGLYLISPLISPWLEKASRAWRTFQRYRPCGWDYNSESESHPGSPHRPPQSRGAVTPACPRSPDGRGSGTPSQPHPGSRL